MAYPAGRRSYYRTLRNNRIASIGPNGLRGVSAWDHHGFGASGMVMRACHLQGGWVHMHSARGGVMRRDADGWVSLILAGGVFSGTSSTSSFQHCYQVPTHTDGYGCKLLERIYANSHRHHAGPSHGISSKIPNSAKYVLKYSQPSSKGYPNQTTMLFQDPYPPSNMLIRHAPMPCIKFKLPFHLRNSLYLCESLERNEFRA